MRERPRKRRSLGLGRRMNRRYPDGAAAAAALVIGVSESKAVSHRTAALLDGHHTHRRQTAAVSDTATVRRRPIFMRLVLKMEGMPRIRPARDTFASWRQAVGADSGPPSETHKISG